MFPFWLQILFQFIPILVEIWKLIRQIRQPAIKASYKNRLRETLFHMKRKDGVMSAGEQQTLQGLLDELRALKTGRE